MQWLKPLSLKDLQSDEAYRDGNILEWMRYGGPGFGVYGRSKLCNILFTRELARRLAGTGVTANCLHPGFVATRFGDRSGGILSFAVRAAKNFALTPEQGASTIIYLASSPEVEGKTGGYYVKSAPATPTKEAQNDDDAKRLWEISARLAGITV